MSAFRVWKYEVAEEPPLNIRLRDNGDGSVLIEVVDERGHHVANIAWLLERKLVLSLDAQRDLVGAGFSPQCLEFDNYGRIQVDDF